MARTVELSADLAELGGNVFVVVDELLVAEGPSCRKSWDEELPAPRAERRRIRRVDLAESGNFALLHKANGLEHELGGRPIGGAYAIIGSPFGWRPFLIQRLIVDG